MKYFALVFVGLLFTFSNGVSGEQEDCPLKKAVQASIEACKDKLTDGKCVLKNRPIKYQIN